MLFVFTALASVFAACATFPEPKLTRYDFPKGAFFGEQKRAYKVIGMVKSRVDFPSLDPAHDEKILCVNYFNKSIVDLVKQAKEHGADAVIDIKSVVFLQDGRSETYGSAECSDDGEEGQVLTQGIAVKWN
ncbi:MAG: hypothetical protein AABZ06_01360 [Bdellovibrionota bacterium]